MANSIFSKSYWGLEWESNLLSKEDKKAYLQNRLAVKKTDLEQGDFDAYVKILDDIISDEKQRLESVENKATQIVGQASIVITILGFFAPALLDKIPGQFLVWRVIFIAGILLISLFFLYSIICALRNFNISKFEFAKTSERTIVDHNNNVFDTLKYEIINDKIFEMRVARHSTNAKASNVIFAFRAFKAAIIILVFYILLYGVAIMVVPDQPQEVKVVNLK